MQGIRHFVRIKVCLKKSCICRHSTLVHLHFFFCKSKLQSRQKGRAAMQMNRSRTSSEISLHGLPSKSKRLSIRAQIASSLSSQLIVLFSRHSHLQRDFQRTFFRAANQNNVSKILRKLTKKHQWQSLILVKLQAFTEAATRGVL